MSSSMHRRVRGAGTLPGPAISLCAQFLEEVHHRLFVGIDKAPACDRLGFGQEFLRFSHFTFSVWPRGVAT